MLIRDVVEAICADRHQQAVEDNYRLFHEAVPAGDGAYAYTYYDGEGQAIYHGYTTSARKRAADHFRSSPWSSWAESVRYRRCRSARSARKLEYRLQHMVPSLCHNGVTTVDGGSREIWRKLDTEYKVNHVTGHCKLPGGICNVGHLMAQMGAAA